eukprot:764242-Hanusia_phi.AAC.2
MSEDSKVMATDNNGELSLSIEQTNALRAQLGLKPLDVQQDGEAKQVEEKLGSSKRPISYMEMMQEEEEKKKSKELQDKIAEMKNARMVASKVMAKKGLGEASDGEDDLDNAAKWVQRSRKKEVDQKTRLARQLEEQDDMVEEQSKEDTKYNSKQLAGMKLAHEFDDFQEGEETILTLADSRVLREGRGFRSAAINEEEDELENVNMSEFQKTQKAKERALRKKKYDATDEDQFVSSNPAEKKILSQYDDFEYEGSRIGGEQKKGMRLGEDGSFDRIKAEQQATVRAKLQAAAAGKKLESLNAEYKFAADFATVEEEKFKKSSGKVRKLRKKPKEKLDLKPIEDGGDKGSRSEGNKTKREREEQEEKRKRAEGFERAMRRAAEASEVMRAQDEAYKAGDMEIDDGDFLEDDDKDLTLSLARARKAIHDKKKMQALDAKNLLQGHVQIKEEEEEEEKGGDLVFSITSEFCRNLQGQDAKPNRNALKNARNYVHETEETDLTSSKPDKGGAWKSKEVDIDIKMEAEDDGEMEDDGAAYKEQEAEAKVKQERITAGGALDNEALASRSVSDALKIMREKGLKKEQLAGRTRDERPDESTPHWADKVHGEQLKHMGVKEKEKKEIVITRLDEFGRPMTIKEAWRQLNHNFHGKKPGAKKTEKRKRQFEEEMKMKKMNSGEASVEQMKKVHNLQAKTGQAHMVVLGGASSSVLSSAAHLRK